MSKILLYDIETSPIITYTWRTWQADAIEVIEDWQILCFAYKWLGEKKTYVIAQDDFKRYKPGVNDDTYVIKELWKLFNEADAIIAHNGLKFDDKRSYARFIQNNLSPPSPHINIDTMRIAKKLFGFTSNRLNDLGEYLNVGKKLDTGGFETWKGCLAGDKKSWRIMKRYNIQDVKLLEQVYLKLRPWTTALAALNVLNDRPEVCPRCGGQPLQARGYRITKTNKYQRYQCQQCMGWCQARTAEYKQAEERMQYV